MLNTLFIGAPLRPEKLNEFFAVVYNFLSEQKNLPKKCFKHLYCSLANKELLDYETYSNFITETYPLLGELLGAFFESRLLNLRPRFNYFLFRSSPSDSFMTEEIAFGLYLTNPLFCQKKGVRLFPIYSSNNIQQSGTDALSYLISFQTQNGRGSFLCPSPRRFAR